MLELSPSLHAAYFAPAAWAADNRGDCDMSAEPALVGEVVLLAGKSQAAVLLNGWRLGGIGGQEAPRQRCAPSDVDGGMAVMGPCLLPC